MSRRRGSIQRDSNDTWRLVVDVGARGAARQQIRRRGFRTKGEAQRALNDILGAHQRGELVRPDKITLHEYLETWLGGLEVAGHRPTTISSYRHNLRLHVVPPLGSARLQELATADLDRLYATLRQKGRRDGKGGLSPKSVRYIHGILRRAFADAVRKGLLVRNPAEAASPPSARAARAPEMAFWTPEELASFLQGIRGHHLFPLFRLTAFTGLRRGEVCGLRWADVDLDEARLVVSQQIAVVDYSLVVGPVKTDHGRRTIDLDAATVRALELHKAAQAELRIALGAGWRDNDLVFCAPDGSPLHPGEVSKVFGRLVRRSGCPQIRFHDLRHSHASHLISTNADLKAIATRMGHASASFTLDRYGHLLPGRQAEAARAVATLVDNSTPSTIRALEPLAENA